MGVVGGLRWIVARIDQALNIVAMALIAGLLAVVTAGIVSRWANHPFGWTDEVSGVLMVWLACIGWMIAARNRAHIRINVFQDKLPARAWRVAEVAIQCAIACVGGVVAWRSLWAIRTNWDIELISLPLSAAWLYVPLLPAGLITLGQAIADLFQPKAATAQAEVATL